MNKIRKVLTVVFAFTLAMISAVSNICTTYASTSELNKTKKYIKKQDYSTISLSDDEYTTVISYNKKKDRLEFSYMLFTDYAYAYVYFYGTKNMSGKTKVKITMSDGDRVIKGTADLEIKKYTEKTKLKFKIKDTDDLVDSSDKDTQELFSVCSLIAL